MPASVFAAPSRKRSEGSSARLSSHARDFDAADHPAISDRLIIGTQDRGCAFAVFFDAIVPMKWVERRKRPGRRDQE